MESEVDPNYDAVTQPLKRLGRRMTDSEKLTFPIAVGKAAIWLVGTMLTVTGGLLVWLCLSTMSLRDQVKDTNAQILVLIERTSNYKDQIQNLAASDQAQQLANARLSLEVKELQLQAASHGWKRGN